MADKNSQTAPDGSTAASISSSLFTTATRPSSSFSSLSSALSTVAVSPQPHSSALNRQTLPSALATRYPTKPHFSSAALSTVAVSPQPHSSALSRQTLPSALATRYSTKPHFSSASPSPRFPSNISIRSGYLEILPTTATATGSSSSAPASSFSTNLSTTSGYLSFIPTPTTANSSPSSASSLLPPPNPSSVPHVLDRTSSLLPSVIPGGSVAVVTVEPGEDVGDKLASISRLRGGRRICVLSAIGGISTATLRDPTSPTGTTTHAAGDFELVSLTVLGSGSLFAHLMSADGDIVMGRVDGSLIAGSIVHIVAYPVGNSSPTGLPDLNL